MLLRRGLLKQMASNGKDFISGTVTIPNDVSSYTVLFGKSFGSYLFLLEMTDESKATALSSGATAARGYAFIGCYPRRSMNNTPSESIIVDRYNPSASTSSYGALTGNQLSQSGITLNVVGMTESGWDCLIKGCTYNYTVVSLE